MKFSAQKLYESKFLQEWKEYALIDLAEWINGRAFRNSDYSEDGIPIIKIAELNNGIKSNTEYSNKMDIDKKYLLSKGDLLFSWSGNPKTSIDSFLYPFNEGWLNQHIYKVVENEIIKKQYLYFLLKYLKPNFERIASNKQTTGLGHVTKADFKKIIVRIPSLLEQKTIAATLSVLDDKIEWNNRINKNLEAQAQTIFKLWFEDFDFPDKDDKPYKLSGGVMVESELGLIPEGWSVEELGYGNLGKLIPSGIDEFLGEKIYLATADVDGVNIVNNETFITAKEKPSRANMQPKSNTVWFAKMKDSRKLIFVHEKDDLLKGSYIFSTGFAGIQCTKVSVYYLWTYIQSERFDLQKNNLCIGTTMQAINNSNIRKIKLVLPEKKILEEFNSIIEPMYRKIFYNRNENQTLTKIRDSLLPKLMSGEIRIPLD